MKTDIRWIQRLDNYTKALETLLDAINLYNQRGLSKLEKQGLIQSFEYTHELAWNLMRDYLAYQGNSEIHGSRDASREAFALGLIADGHIWMNMIKSRNKTSHTYNEETAEEITKEITGEYALAFTDFQKKMQLLRQKEN